MKLRDELKRPSTIAGIILVIYLVVLVTCTGCTTIKREAVQLDGTRSVYTVTSMLNSKTIAGLKFKDCNGCMELSLTNYTSNQDEALRVVLAALEAYLKTKTP